MLENISKIALTGKMFDIRTKFLLFPTPEDRVVLLYGKNGSGKSTIAQAFREYKDGQRDPHWPVDIEFLSNDDKHLLLEKLMSDSTEPKSKIFVFDENYVDRNLRIDASGLGSIVLLGKQVGIEKEIEEATQRRDSLAKDQTKQQAICEQYSNPKSSISPEFHFKAIKEILSQGWAERDKNIRGNSKKTSVTAELIGKLGTMDIPQKTRSKLEHEYEEKFSMFSQTGKGAVPITSAITCAISFSSDIEDNAAALFPNVLQKQELSEREQQLLDLFQPIGLAEAKAFLSDETHRICPKCLQDILPTYRAKVRQQINLIFNQEVKDFQKQLEGLLLQESSFILPDNCKNLDTQLFDEAVSAIARLTELIKAFNNAIKKKMNVLYEALPYTPIGLTDALFQVKQALAAIEAKRVSFNESIRDRNNLMQRLRQLNDEIACYSIADEYAAYVRSSEEKQQADHLWSEITSKLEAEKEHIRQLEAQRANIEIAVEQINSALKYIFFCENRLSLKSTSDGRYQLFSKGKKITPKNISCGERNAIALCYFFTEIGRGMDWNEAYHQELFLVVDDPISSFDLENKVGIASFLRQRFAQVLQGCATSKVLFMTHDIQVVYDMQKVFEEIHKATNKKALFSLKELQNGQLVDFSYKSHNEYSSLMKLIFGYASGNKSETSDWMIGNTMRRVLEAFATFSYTKGIVAVSTEKDILALIEEPKRSYFENLMYRLVLNDESHFSNYVKSAPSMNFFECLSPTDKQRTARDVLCLMHLLNEKHVLLHLTGEKNVQENLKKWCAAIS